LCKVGDRVHLVDVLDMLGDWFGAGHPGAETLEQPGRFGADAAQRDDEDGLLAHLLSSSTAPPIDARSAVHAVGAGSLRRPGSQAKTHPVIHGVW